MRFLTLITSALLCCSGTAFAASAAQIDHVQLAAGNFAPYTTSEAENGGMLTEVVERAFSKVGIQAETHFMPWKRSYAETEAARQDGTFPWSITNEREEAFLYSEPLYTFVRRGFVMADSAIQAQTPEALAGKRMCRPQGYSLQGVNADMANKGLITHIAPPDMPTCFRMLAVGRVDYVVLAEGEGWANAKSVLGGKGKVRALDIVFYQYTNHLIVSRKHPNGKVLIKQFNEGLHRLKASGEYQAILENNQ